MRLVCITHLYNEEELLPYWIEWHQNIFDDVLVIDYNSTDKSIQLIKELAPKWSIVSSENPEFNAIDVDFEVMKYEETFGEGAIKIVLNTTEFLHVRSIDKLQKLFTNFDVGYKLRGWVSIAECEGAIDTPLSDAPIRGFWEDEVIFQLIPRKLKWMKSPTRSRFLHNFRTGAYTPGRHATFRPVSGFIDTSVAFIDWWAFKPWNEQMISRKMQFSSKIPQIDKIHGNGLQHLSPRLVYEEQYKYLRKFSYHFRPNLNDLRVSRARKIDTLLAHLKRIIWKLLP